MAAFCLDLDALNFILAGIESGTFINLSNAFVLKVTTRDIANVK